MCGQVDSWELGRLPPELFGNAELRPNYDHFIFVGGRGWGRTTLQHELEQHLLVDEHVAARGDYLDGRPIDEVVWQHFRDRIERSDHASNDDHGSLRFSTALRGSEKLDW